MALSGLPARGAAVRGLGLPLPPQRMPRRQGARPLKRWRYVGVYGPDLMLCVGEARVGPMPQRWWAVALPDGTLRQHTTLGRGGVDLSPGHASVDSRALRLRLDFEEDEGVETASRGRAQLDLDAQARRPARDRLRRARRPPLRDRRRGGGRRERRATTSATPPGAGRPGVGRGAGGERVAWNLVDGVHDAEHDSERTVWVDGKPHEAPPVPFAADLSAVGELRFEEWSAREDHTNLLLFRSDYRQPFGTFSGRAARRPRAEPRATA